VSTDGVGSSVQPFGAEEAWLWAPPDQQPPAPPVTTKPERLPIHKLSWENTERLFLRLLEKQGKVQWAKLYGTSGQHQEGIDAYARLIPLADNAAGDSRGRLQQRPYAVLQSRRVERLYPSGIKSAVADFLAGDWSDDTGTFFYATSFDLTDTRLDAALRESADRLAEVEIRFVPWGVVEVSELLRSLPRLVDDFFGRAWVEHFCGPSALAALSPRLTFSELRDLRGRLAELYAAVFDSQAAIRRPTDGASVGRAVGARFADGHFIMPDVSSHSSSIIGDLSLVADDIARAEGNESLTPRWSIPGRSSTDSVAKQELPRTTLSESSSAITEGGERVVNSSRLGRQRRCLRSVRALLVGEPAPEGDNTFREPADTWLSLGNRNLLGHVSQFSGAHAGVNDCTGQ
jgi:hypothetical protein